MKRITLIALVLFSFIPAFATEAEAENELYKHHYDYRGFTELSVSNSFIVDLSFEDSWSLDIEVPDFIEPYLRISCNEARLRIGLENLPNDIQRKLNNDKRLYAKVKMPKITKLIMSGATKLSTAGIPALESHESLEIKLSGASQVENLQAGSKGKLSIDMSGATKAEIKADFQKLDIDLSGASKLKFEGSADFIKVECSGASSARLEGNFNDADVDVNGSSNVTLTDDLDSIRLEVSGASKFELEGTVATADVELSGASKARLAVSKKMNYEISGVSTLRVKDLNAQIRGEISRGSKIDYIK